MNEELRTELNEICDSNPSVRRLMLHFSVSDDVAYTTITDLVTIVGKDPTDMHVREIAEELLKYFSDQLALGFYVEVDDADKLGFSNHRIDWDISTSSLGHYFSGLVDEVEPISHELRKERESEDEESEDGESEDGESEDGESEDGESEDGESEDGESEDGESEDGMTLYSIPFREGMNLEFTIPDDITLEEVGRICKHLLALVPDDLKD